MLSSQFNTLKCHITKYNQTLHVVLLVHKDTGINVKCTKQIGLTAFFHYEIMSHIMPSYSARGSYALPSSLLNVPLLGQAL